MPGFENRLRPSIIIIKPCTEEMRNILLGVAKGPNRKITIVTQSSTGASLLTQPDKEEAKYLLEKLKEVEPFSQLPGTVFIDL